MQIIPITALIISLAGEAACSDNLRDPSDTRKNNLLESQHTFIQILPALQLTDSHQVNNWVTVENLTLLKRDSTDRRPSSAEPRIGELQQTLLYCLPLLCAIVVPFSAINIYLLILQDAHTRPSYLLYVHILLADILTVVGGISLVIHFRTENSTSIWLFNNMIWLSFYTEVPLLFGLVIIRIIAAHVQISTWIAHGYKIAKLIVGLSWTTGLGVTVLHDSITFGDVGSVVKDVAIMSVVIPTCVMNLYVWATLRRAVNHNFEEASKTALLLFFNFVFCYAYFTSTYLFFICTFIAGDGRCSTKTWWGLLFCTNQGRHYVGECFMLLQSLGNNSVLLYNSRRAARIVWEYYRNKLGGQSGERAAILGNHI